MCVYAHTKAWACIRMCTTCMQEPVEIGRGVRSHRAGATMPGTAETSLQTNFDLLWKGLRIMKGLYLLVLVLAFSGARLWDNSGMLTRSLPSSGMLTSLKPKCLFRSYTLCLFSFCDSDFLWAMLVRIISVLKSFRSRLAKWDKGILSKKRNRHQLKWIFILVLKTIKSETRLWWLGHPLIPPLGRLKQADHCEFDSLG